MRLDILKVKHFNSDRKALLFAYRASTQNDIRLDSFWVYSPDDNLFVQNLYWVYYYYFLRKVMSPLGIDQFSAIRIIWNIHVKSLNFFHQFSNFMLSFGLQKITNDTPSLSLARLGSIFSNNTSTCWSTNKFCLVAGQQ